MIKTFFLYTVYILATAAVTGFAYLNLAPQFGSNPTSSDQKQYEKFQITEMEFL